MMKDRMILIDGPSLIYRAFYAISNMTTSRGEPTGAIYGFCKMLMNIMKDMSPEYALIAFDAPGPTFRHEEYEGYKETRKKMPDDLVSQIVYIKEILKGLGIKTYELDKYEADDIIGTFTKIADKNDASSTIITGDRDLLQLLSSNTEVVLCKRGITDIKRYDVSSFKKEYGFLPEKLVDYKALMGDQSDDIPGVRGIGKITASKLITSHGDLDNLFNKIKEIDKTRTKNLLKEGENIARLSKQLATIDVNSPVDIDLVDCKVDEPDKDILRSLFTKLEFSQFLDEMDLRPEGEENTDVKGCILDSDNIIKEFCLRARKQGTISFTVITDNEDSMKAKILGLSLGLSKKDAGFLPLGNHTKKVSFLDHIIPEPVISILQDPDIKKVCHDGKYDIMVLNGEGVKLKGLTYDTMIASYLVEGEGSEDISRASGRYLLRSGLEDGKRRGFNHENLFSSDEMNRFCGFAADILGIKDILSKRISELGMEKLFNDIEMPLVSVLAEMELLGISCDREQLQQISSELQEKADTLRETIYHMAGEEFNVNSTKQVGTIFFEKLGLPVLRRTKTGYSTSADVLEKLKGQHPIVNVLLEYRHLMKLKSTYTDSLFDLINPETGRIHTSFKQAVTATGRLSSKDPNLQNIPIKTEEGRKIRKVFVPGHGADLSLSADYSQVELRVLAHISKDEKLKEAFHNDEDIHQRTASEVFGVELEDVSKQMRNAAKAVNFGIVYGISGFGLSQSLNVSREEAEEYISKYLDKYKGVAEYMEKTVSDAKDKGYVTTLLGRKRDIAQLKDRNSAVRQFGERTAINTPIQGTAADIIKVAMVKLAEKDLFAHLLLQVHDELLLEVSSERLKETAYEVKTTMEEAYKLSVPLKVDLAKGENWSEMHDFYI